MADNVAPVASVHPGHDDSVVADGDTLSFQVSRMASFRPGDQPTRCGNDAPPRDLRAIFSQGGSDCTRRSGLTDLGCDLSVGDDFPWTQLPDDFEHSLCELGYLCIFTHDDSSSTTSIGSGNPLIFSGPTGTADVLTIIAETNSLGASS